MIPYNDRLILSGERDGEDLCLHFPESHKDEGLMDAVVPLLITGFRTRDSPRDIIVWNHKLAKISRV